MELVDLFPRTIAVATLQSLTPERIEQAIELIEFGAKADLGGDGAYTLEQQMLDKAPLREVKREILGLCLEFSRAYSHDVREVAICNSWGNVLGQQQSIRYHKHNNSYISGSFYLTEGSDFNILNSEFNELFGLVPAATPDARDNYRAWESFNLPPRPGRVVLFPSGLRHCVLPSRGEAKRYSIAFNAVPVGRIGTPTGLLDLGRP